MRERRGRSLGGRAVIGAPPSVLRLSRGGGGDQRNQKDKERKEEKGSKHFPLYGELPVDGLPTAEQQPEFMTRAMAACVALGEFGEQQRFIPHLKNARHRHRITLLFLARATFLARLLNASVPASFSLSLS